MSKIMHFQNTLFHMFTSNYYNPSVAQLAIVISFQFPTNMSWLQGVCLPLRRPPPSTEGIWLWLRWPWGRWWRWWWFFLFLWLLKLSVSFCSFFFLSYHHHIVSLSVIPSSRSSPFPTSRFLNMSDVFF